MLICFLVKASRAHVPKVTITLGFTISICVFKNGQHRSISCGVGVRLFIGRALTIFVMKTSDRSIPHCANVLLSSCPARPTNVFFCISSSFPGASPTNMSVALVFPSPNTRLVFLSMISGECGLFRSLLYNCSSNCCLFGIF